MTLVREEHSAQTSAAGLDSAKAHLWLQALALAMLYTFPVLVCAHSAPVTDMDAWWHLRTGEWIVQHGAVPRAEPFTSFAAGKPWLAYSWLFDLLIYQLYIRLGLTGLVVYTASMVALITMALHRLIRRLQPDFIVGVLLTLAACLCMAHVWTPRPWLFSILLFVVELDVLMNARRNAKSSALWILPVIFALWANLHIQFIDGLIVLGIALTDAALAWYQKRVSTLKFSRIGLVFASCVAATLLNPYGWRIYGEAYSLTSQKGVLGTITEMTAMPFRDPANFGVLFFALAAAGVVARAPRQRLFEITLLIFAAIVSFRSQRDAWVVVAVASAILASGIERSDQTRSRLKTYAAPIAIMLFFVAAPLAYMVMRLNNPQLSTKVEAELPVEAVKFVKDNGISGPLFNDYDWGGYLIWDLRIPVSIDGRAALDGDELINRSGATWGGGPDWACDPDLKRANLVIGPVNAPLTQLLTLTSHFELRYRDKTAAVFVSRKTANPPGGRTGCIQ